MTARATADCAPGAYGFAVARGARFESTRGWTGGIRKLAGFTRRLDVSAWRVRFP